MSFLFGRALSIAPLRVWLNDNAQHTDLSSVFLRSWNNGTSNLFIESPAGVGFSYCDTPEGCQHTDDSTAVDNLNALLAFFKSYPELKSNDFWIAGESYAGIYIPMLAYAIYQNNLVNPSQYIDLKGVAVGNGCIGYEAGHCGSGGINDKNDIVTWRGVCRSGSLGLC